MFVSLELVQREWDVHLSSSNRAVVWSVSAARIIYVKHDEPPGGTEDLGTGGVLGKVLGRTGLSTVRHFRPWLWLSLFFSEITGATAENRTECVNEGRGEFHSFGESFPSNKAIMLSPPTFLQKGATLEVELRMQTCKVMACLLSGNLV